MQIWKKNEIPENSKLKIIREIFKTSKIKNTESGKKIRKKKKEKKTGKFLIFKIRENEVSYLHKWHSKIHDLFTLSIYSQG